MSCSHWIVPGLIVTVFSPCWCSLIGFPMLVFSKLREILENEIKNNQGELRSSFPHFTNVYAVADVMEEIFSKYIWDLKPIGVGVGYPLIIKVKGLAFGLSQPCNDRLELPTMWMNIHVFS
jgi:hypothetical protein